MIPHLEVLNPGLHTTVQDLGRFGYLSIGVPVSGALDGVSLRLANALVGNPPETAGLEMLVQGPTIAVGADSARIALVGAAAGLEVLGPEPRRAPPGRSLLLHRGQTFRVAALREGFCACLAVEGGFDLPPCLGSLATYVRAGIGGFEGRELRPGDRLRLAREGASERDESMLPRPVSRDQEGRLRIMLGPQDDHFTARAIETLLGAPFRISADADRMGFRLDGPRLEHRRDYNIVSDGIATGAIQVPGSGQPVVLLADHQSTGGYPKIGAVITADLPALVRRRPGDEVRFRAVDVAEAERLFDAAEAEIADLARNIEPVPDGVAPRLEALYDANLISGVVDATDASSWR